MANAENCTVPVAVAGETVAVKVTAVPKVDTAVLPLRLVVVLGLLTACWTAKEVLVASFASPLYTATMECVPKANEAVVKEADPPETVPVPKSAPPSRN